MAASISRAGRGKWSRRPPELRRKGYFNTLAKLYDLLAQVNGRNCTVEDFAKYQETVRSKMTELRRWKDRKKRRNKKPVNEKSLQLFAARDLADHRGIAIQDALKIVHETWPNPPKF
jgi:hypothetical protein